MTMNGIYCGAMRAMQAGLRVARRLGLTGDDMTWRMARKQVAALDRPVWLHAASVGEVASVLWIVDRLRDHFPVLVSTNTTTGLALACNAAGRAARYPMSAQLAPLDTPDALRRFLDHHAPRLYIATEAELWPNRSAALDDRGVAQAMIGARISARSARRWARLRGVIEPVLQRQAAFCAQNAVSEATLLSLGARPAARLSIIQLKLLGPLRTLTARMPMPNAADRAYTVLAASTHAGEDALIIDAFLLARARNDAARLIIAPRHPQRGDAIAALLMARGQTVRRRSSGDTGADAAILLADSLGEMDDWYRRAGICVVAGSYADLGGHTPWEPAAHGCAIIHGPHISNHADGYARLAAAGAAIAVNADGLTETLDILLDDAPRCVAMGRTAQRVLRQNAGDPAPLIERLIALAR